MELGDKLYVKKYFVDQKSNIVIKPGEIFKISDIEYFALDNDEDVIFLKKFNEPDEYDLDIHFAITIISDYFYTEKEMRKLKLQKLTSKQLALKLR